uniref:Uncharacterized protein n=1 Tax=Oryza glumipatula TaxID=40148 RepID=A0A0E0BK03_9ORYZ
MPTTGARVRTTEERRTTAPGRPPLRFCLISAAPRLLVLSLCGCGRRQPGARPPLTAATAHRSRL